MSETEVEEKVEDQFTASDIASGGAETFLTRDEGGRPKVVNSSGNEVGMTGANFIGADDGGKPVVIQNPANKFRDKSNAIFQENGRTIVRDLDEGGGPGESNGDADELSRDLKNALKREETAKKRVGVLTTSIEDLNASLESAKELIEELESEKVTQAETVAALESQIKILNDMGGKNGSDDDKA